MMRYGVRFAFHYHPARLYLKKVGTTSSRKKEQKRPLKGKPEIALILEGAGQSGNVSRLQ